MTFKAKISRRDVQSIHPAGQNVNQHTPRQRARHAAALVVNGTLLKPSVTEAATAAQVPAAMVAQEIAKIGTANSNKASVPLIDMLLKAMGPVERVDFVRRNQGSLWEAFDQITAI
jgi:hypothetical protein